MTVLEQRTCEAVQQMNGKLPDLEKLELRDLFAMNALNGINASWTTGNPWVDPVKIRTIARWSYALADAMLEARELYD